MTAYVVRFLRNHLGAALCNLHPLAVSPLLSPPAVSRSCLSRLGFSLSLSSNAVVGPSTLRLSPVTTLARNRRHIAGVPVFTGTSKVYLCIPFCSSLPGPAWMQSRRYAKARGTQPWPSGAVAAGDDDGDDGPSADARRVIVPSAAAAVPILPYRLRSRADDTDPSKWLPLTPAWWRSTVSAACMETARLFDRDPFAAMAHAPELWRCNADGQPASGQLGKVDISRYAIFQLAATQQPRPPELDLLLQRDSDGNPCAFVLFTIPCTATAAAVAAAASASATAHPVKVLMYGAPAAAALPRKFLDFGCEMDVPALVAFLRGNYPKGQLPALPLGLGGPGALFPIVGCTAAANVLWEIVESRFKYFETGVSSGDKPHPFPLVAGGPGSGKTRLLWESLALLQQVAVGEELRCRSGNAVQLRQTLAAGVRIYVSYGRPGLLPAEFAPRTVAGGFAARLLHAHFCPHESLETFTQALAHNVFGVDQTSLFQKLQLREALMAVAHDVERRWEHGGRFANFAERYRVVLVAVDEVTSIASTLLREVLNSMADTMFYSTRAVSGRFIVLQPVLGGDAQSKMLCEAVMGMYVHRPNPLKLPPLRFQDALTILTWPGILPPTLQGLVGDPAFLELVADLVGYTPRLLETLVTDIQIESANLETAAIKTMVDALRGRMQRHVQSAYGDFADLTSVALARVVRRACLSRPDQRFCSKEDYAADEDMALRGLVVRSIAQTYSFFTSSVHIPLMFLQVWGDRWLSDPAFAAVKHLINHAAQAAAVPIAEPAAPAMMGMMDPFAVEVLRMEALRMACAIVRDPPRVPEYDLADWLHGAVGDVSLVRSWRTIAQPDNPVAVFPHRVPFPDGPRFSSVDYESVETASDNLLARRLNTSDKPVAVRDVLMGLVVGEAPFDLFSARVLNDNRKQGLLCIQTKRTSTHEPGHGGAKLTLAQIHAEHEKIAVAMGNERLRRHFGCTRAKLPFVVLLHTTQPLAADVTAAALPPLCFVVGRGQVADYFGPTLGGHIQRAARLSGAWAEVP